MMGRVYLMAIIAALACGAVFWFLRKRKSKRRDSETPFTGNVDAKDPLRTCGATKFRDNHWEHDARELARAGRKIEAIKLVRERTGLDLKSAKDYVERL
jgi:hypothetical protein